METRHEGLSLISRQNSNISLLFKQKNAIQGRLLEEISTILFVTVILVVCPVYNDERKVGGRSAF